VLQVCCVLHLLLAKAVTRFRLFFFNGFTLGRYR
jgi:hypothetical protein